MWNVSAWDYSMWMRMGLYFMELVACATGFLFWRKVSHTHWRWFPFYLGAIFLLEVTAHFSNDTVNGFIGTYVLIPLEYLFFYWLFYAYFKQHRVRYWAIGAATVFVAAWLAEVVWVKHLHLKTSFTSLSYMAGNLLLVVLLVLFFVRFTISHDILYYRSNLMFWVCIGAIVFYLVTLPFFGLYNSLYKHSRILYLNYWKVMMVLNYLMYGFFILGFVWSKKR